MLVHRHADVDEFLIIPTPSTVLRVGSASRVERDLDPEVPGAEVP
jgi:hypothetical protein